MRDFSKTPEPPPGDADAAERNLRFVVQQHAARNMHWDFRLEVDGVLKSWPLPKGPSTDPKIKRQGIMTEDHPYEYRTFEGVIPKGEYGGGQVIVWDGASRRTKTARPPGTTRRVAAAVNEGIGAASSLSRCRASSGLLRWSRQLQAEDLADAKAQGQARRKRTSQQDARCARADDQDLKEGKCPMRRRCRWKRSGARLGFPGTVEAQTILGDTGRSRLRFAAWLWEPKLDGVRTLTFINKARST